MSNREKEYENVQRWLSIAKRCCEADDAEGEETSLNVMKSKLKRLRKSLKEGGDD